MLAQAASALSSVPVTIGAWLGCLFFAVALYNAISTAVRGMKDRPAPADVRAEAVDRFQPKGDYATRSDLTALETRINDMSRASDTSRAELRAHIDAKVVELDHKMEAVRRELAEKIDEQAKEFGQALRDQPNQIVALLRNTGALS